MSERDVLASERKRNARIADYLTEVASAYRAASFRQVPCEEWQRVEAKAKLLIRDLVEDWV